MIWIENIWRLVVLLFLQVLLINNLHFMGICSPCIYILFLIALPLKMHPMWLLGIAGALGLCMDAVTNTPGVNMAACVLLMYMRPFVIHRIIPDDERLIGTFSTQQVDVGTYTKVVAILTLIHHSVLFIFLNFTWHNWWLILLQIILSSALTILMLVGWDFFKHR